MSRQLRHRAGLHGQRRAARKCAAPQRDVDLVRASNKIHSRAAPARESADLQKHRTQELEDRHRYLSQAWRLRRAEESPQKVAGRHRERSEDIWIAWPRRGRIFLRREVELHQGWWEERKSFHL